VANTAIRHVTNTFKAMKEARLANHDAYIKALPYFAIYEQYNGHPPINPHVLSTLRRQLHEAEVDLRRNIDSDWRQCVVRYPEVLTHYYSMVNVNIPKDASPPAGLIPAVPTLMPQAKIAPPPERARSTTGTTVKWYHRKEANSALKHFPACDKSQVYQTTLFQAAYLAPHPATTHLVLAQECRTGFQMAYQDLVLWVGYRLA